MTQPVHIWRHSINILHILLFEDKNVVLLKIISIKQDTFIL